MFSNNMQFVKKANLLDQLYAIDENGNEPLYAPQTTLMTIDDIINSTKTNYENITKENKKRKAGGSAPKYKDVPIDPAASGTFANPHIEKRRDPNTGMITDNYVVQRDDKQWVAYTPEEYDAMKQQLATDKIDVTKVGSLPVKRDMYDPKNQAAQATNTVVNPGAEIAKDVIAGQKQGKAEAKDAAEDYLKAQPNALDPMQAVKSITSTGESFSGQVPDLVNYEIEKRNYEAKKALRDKRLEEAIERVNKFNSDARYMNATSMGYTPDSYIEYKNPEEKALRMNPNVNIGSSGNRVPLIPPMDEPSKPYIEEPAMPMTNVSFSAMAMMSPNPNLGRQREPAVTLPTFDGTGYNLLYPDKQKNLEDMSKKWSLDPTRYSTLKSNVKNMEGQTFAKGYNYDSKVDRLNAPSADGKIVPGNWSLNDMAKNILKDLHKAAGTTGNTGMKGHPLQGLRSSGIIDANGNLYIGRTVRKVGDAEVLTEHAPYLQDLLLEISKFLTTGYSDVVNMLPAGSVWKQYTPDHAKANTETIYSHLNPAFKDKEGIRDSFESYNIWLFKNSLFTRNIK